MELDLPISDNESTDLPRNQTPLAWEDALSDAPVNDPPAVPLQQLGPNVFLERYPSETAGQPIRQAMDDELPNSEYPDVGELSNPKAFQLAKLMIDSGLSGGYRERFFRLKMFKRRMPWKRNRALLKDIDQLPHGPDWEVQTMEVTGNQGTEIVEFWKRNPLHVIKRILVNPRYKDHLQYVPTREWTCRRMKKRRRGEIWTCDRMWELQQMIEEKDPNATVIPTFISSDETRLTNFVGDKKAHPVYMTIGNLPKLLRRGISKHAVFLIGYLPVPKLDCETSDIKRCETKRKLFHQCMEELLAPLAAACQAGEEVPCSDGGIRRIYPVLTAYIADYPEQCKVACTKQSYCPICTVAPEARGDLGDSPLRDREQTLDAMDEHERTGSALFEDLGLLRIKPFWVDHEYVDVATFLTPDLLHQLHKGMFKDHLAKWATTIMSKNVIDERYKSMPEHHGVKHFKNGITSVSQWTGRELKEMAKVLLPLLSDENWEVVRAARALLDFMYLAHSSSLTDDELDAMDEALRTFHAHKHIFEELGAVTTEKAFHGIPKLHMISHYTHQIRQLGTPDGYNTETPERLHIDFAKAGYRASNKVNATRQMALYIQRREAVYMHAAYLSDRRRHRLAMGLAFDADDHDDQDDDDDDGEFGDEFDEDEFEDEFEDAADDFDEDDEEDRMWDEYELSVLAQEGPRIGLDEYIAQRGGWEEKVGDNAVEDQQSTFYPDPDHKLATKATLPAVTGAYLIKDHGATNLISAIRSFLAKEAPACRDTLVSPQHRFNVWSRVRLLHSPPPFKPTEGPKTDVIRALPAKVDRYGRVQRRAHFDTALILTRPERNGIHRYRPGRVRAIFELPSHIHNAFPHKLAYVELFNDFSANPADHVGLFTTSHRLLEGKRVHAVVPLAAIRMACHLAPRYSVFQLETPLTLQTDLLEMCRVFFLNIFASYFFYELLQHWSQAGGTQ